MYDLLLAFSFVYLNEYHSSAIECPWHIQNMETERPVLDPKAIRRNMLASGLTYLMWKQHIDIQAWYLSVFRVFPNHRPLQGFLEVKWRSPFKAPRRAIMKYGAKAVSRPQCLFGSGASSGGRAGSFLRGCVYGSSSLLLNEGAICAVRYLGRQK